MANEISVTLAFSALKNSVTTSYPSRVDKFDQTGFGSQELLVTTGAAAQLALTGTPGVCVFENRDLVDDIIIGPEDPGLPTAMADFIRLRPGKAVVLDLDSPVDVWARSAANTPQLLVVVMEQ